jgi:hypothetical protein
MESDRLKGIRLIVQINPRIPSIMVSPRTTMMKHGRSSRSPMVGAVDS